MSRERAVHRTLNHWHYLMAVPGWGWKYWSKWVCSALLVFCVVSVGMCKCVWWIWYVKNYVCLWWRTLLQTIWTLKKLKPACYGIVDEVVGTIGIKNISIEFIFCISKWVAHTPIYGSETDTYTLRLMVFVLLNFVHKIRWISYAADLSNYTLTNYYIVFSTLYLAFILV